jgi:hypothetical protein
VLSWRLSNTMDVSFCVAALEKALLRFGKPEIFNTDQSNQQHGLHRRVQTRRHSDLDGWLQALDGQRVHRAAARRGGEASRPTRDLPRPCSPANAASPTCRRGCEALIGARTAVQKARLNVSKEEFEVAVG